MAIFSPLRYRRFAARQTEPTQQIIAFRLRQEWFALPLNVVRKVISMGNVYGDPKGTGISLTVYQEQELLVVDVSHRIFGETLQSHHNSNNIIHQRFLLIVQTNAEDCIGLPIDSLPEIHRVPSSAFTSLPDAYLVQGNIQCISATSIQLTDRPPLFLLNPDALAKPENTVIPS